MRFTIFNFLPIYKPKTRASYSNTLFVVIISNCILKEKQIDFLEGEIKRTPALEPSQDEAPSKYTFHIPL